MDIIVRGISMIVLDIFVSTEQPAWMELIPTPVDAQTVGKDSTAARTWTSVLTPTPARTTEPVRILRVDTSVSV